MKIESTKYPIAEIFHSIQGEGFWTGTAMSFVRLAGCTVGRPYTVDKRTYLAEIGHELAVYQEECMDWQGVTFPCDTNFVMSRKMSVEDIVMEVAGKRHVCITGGEPLMHNLQPLLQVLSDDSRLEMVHIETSGTIRQEALRNFDFIHKWITVSPKAGYLAEALEWADEIKILVGGSFNEKEFERFLPWAHKLWVQPVNPLNAISAENAKRCVQLCEKYPGVRLSIQLHKVLGLR